MSVGKFSKVSNSTTALAFSEGDPEAFDERLRIGGVAGSSSDHDDVEAAHWSFHLCCLKLLE